MRRYAAALGVVAFSISGAILHAPTTAHAQAAPTQARYAASTIGTVYYWIECDSRWKNLSSENLIFFFAADDAEAAGYTPSASEGCGRQRADVQRPDRRAEGALADRLIVAPALAPLSAYRKLDVAKSAGTCVILRVVDGDTVDCESGERLRLLLANAPEMSESTFGVRARIVLTMLLPPATRASMEFDVQHRDRYGRLLVHVYSPDGLRIGEEMIRQGFAGVAVFPPNVQYLNEFRAAAREAREEGRGLWSLGGFECFGGFRHESDC